MEPLLREIRYTLRRMRRAPLVTLVAVLTLAAGIGATTAVYTLVDRVLLRPLPFADPDRLVVLWESNAELGRERDQVSPPNFLDWQRGSRTLDAMAAFHYGATTLTGTAEPLQLSSARVTPGTFSLLDVPPVLGRGFAADQSGAATDRVVVLSHGLWQRVFGGSRDVVGRTLTLDGAPHEVVGVMPRSFHFPDGDVELWLPLAITGPALEQRSRRSLGVVGRLREGVTAEAAAAELNGLAAALAEAHPRSNEGWGVTVVPAREQLVADVRPALLAMMGAVTLVLLLAAANLAALLMARTSARRREFAIRTALGASRRRIARQTLLESILLALAGGAVGVLIATLLVRGMGRTLGEYLPFAELVAVDARALVFALATSLLVGVLLGIVPALSSARVRSEELRTVASTADPGRRRFQHALVVGEIALALVLTVAAGLLVQSFVKLQRTDPGFDARQVAVARVSLPRTQYPDEQNQLAFFEALLQRLRSRPEIVSAGAVTALPMSRVGIDFDLPVTVAGRPSGPEGEPPQVDFRVATSGYFAAMGMRLVSGRALEDRDVEGAPRVMVVNETMARQFWGTDDPLGGQVTIPMGGAHEVVGVVADVRHRGLDQEPRPEMYVPLQQVTFGTMTLVVRTTGDPAAILALLPREVREIDRDQPVSDVATMEAMVAGSTAEARLGSMLATALALAALFLAAVGIYGVISYSVSTRTRELGVRIALGAAPGRIAALVLAQGMRLAAVGVLVGLVLTVWTTRTISTLLFGVRPFDAATFGGVSLLLLGVALTASMIPMRRAIRTAPAVTLREE